METPTIGLTLDRETEGGYSPLPWYALRQNYCDAVSEAGGLPVALPYTVELAEMYAARIDGLVVTGGHFDVDPSWYGGTPDTANLTLKEQRTAFEAAVTRAALDRDIPVLGLCGGQQLLAVLLGASLYQHIPDAVPGALAHEQPNPRDEAGHDVTVAAGTKLAGITGTGPFGVNSAHHQAVSDPGPALVVNARSPDGLVEGVEDPRHTFVLGVQWHPEYTISPADERLFAAFVDACRTRAASADD